MSGYIPEDKISEIRNTANIVDIVSEAVILKKSGKNFLGLCPFHQEKTPSFTVSPDKQIFHCFGCHEGGNVFSFLMKHQGISFPEAVRMLARRYGISLPQEQRTPEQKKAESERQRLLKANAMAADYFHQKLIDDPQSAPARSYVAKRGLTKDIVDHFKLGVAPAGWDNLLSYLSNKGFPPRVLEQAGLVVKKQSGGYYDRFRNRLMFPITDVAGRIIAFGGRVFDDSLPKYLNSPETPLYNKRRTLYGLESAKQKCRETETVYITEGYMDFLAVYRHGIQNVVATLGTSMTVEHVHLLKGYVTRAVMVFDSDEAGIKAARRGIELFSGEKGIKPFILSLPEGYDPDSYLMQYGAGKFQHLAANAREAMLFLIDEAVKKHGLSVDGKLRVISEMETVVAAVDDELARLLYVKELAERLKIEERAVLDRVNKAVAEIKSGATARHGNAGDIPLPGKQPADFGSGKYRIERQLVEMMLHAPFMLPEIDRTGILKNFDNNDLAAIGRIILNHRRIITEPKADMMALVELVDNDEQKRMMTSLLVGDELSPKEWNASDCHKLVQQFVASCHAGEDDLSARIKAAENSHDDNLLEQLLETKRDRLRRIKNEAHTTER